MRARLEIEGNEEELEVVLRASDLRFALREISAALGTTEAHEIVITILEELKLMHLVEKL